MTFHATWTAQSSPAHLFVHCLCTKCRGRNLVRDVFQWNFQSVYFSIIQSSRKQLKTLSDCSASELYLISPRVTTVASSSGMATAQIRVVGSSLRTELSGKPLVSHGESTARVSAQPSRHRALTTRASVGGEHTRQATSVVHVELTYLHT